MLEGEPYIVCNGGEDPNCSISLFQGYNLTYPVAYSCHIKAINEYCDHWHFNLTGYCMQGRNLTFTKLLGIA
uniref:Uncharacterized protein n=1 Tax=Acrobeloides nanus TaxID=290746 RepID=A0A914E663_9BILA